MADIQVLEQGNGGEISILGNDLVGVSGVENMPYLAMFGGDANYWGNDLLFADNESFRFTSETETLLKSVSLTSGNRILIEEAIKRDLQFLLDNVPDTVLTVQTQIISDNKLLINVDFGGIPFSMLWNPTAAAVLPAPHAPMPTLIWISPILSGESSSYAITDFTMSYGATVVSFSADVFYSTSNETATIAGYNALALSYGMAGNFAIVDNNIVYNQGASEAWSVTLSPVVLPEMMVVELAVPVPSGSTQNWSYGYAGINSNQVVDFGDAQSPVWYHPSDIFVQTASHSYIDGLTAKTVNIFHDDTLILVMVFGNSSTAYRVSAVSNPPISIETLSISSQKLTNPCNIDLTGLLSLNTISIVGSSVTAFTPSLFRSPNPSLRLVLLGNNNLSSAEVDDAFVTFVAENPALADMATGQFRTVGQTPAAAPTGTSLAARTALTGAGCLVVTD